MRAVEKARTAAFDSAVRAGRSQAAELAYKKQYAEALALIDTLLALAPQNQYLAADKAMWTSVKERAARDEVARQARAEAADKARAEREERQKKDQVDREAAQQAEREARAKVETERKERDEASRRSVEEKRLGAIAEKQRKQSEAEEAQRQKDDAKKREAAAKLAAAQAAGPSTVEYNLPARQSAGVEVLKKLVVPTGCQIAVTSFLAKPSACRGNCSPRTVTRATMTCTSGKLVYMRDQAHVWLTCDGDKQMCSECLATGKTALAPIVNGSVETLQGCKNP